MNAFSSSQSARTWLRRCASALVLALILSTMTSGAVGAPVSLIAYAAQPEGNGNGQTDNNGGGNDDVSGDHNDDDHDDNGNGGNGGNGNDGDNNSHNGNGHNNDGGPSGDHNNDGHPDNGNGNDDGDDNDDDSDDDQDDDDSDDGDDDSDEDEDEDDSDEEDSDEDEDEDEDADDQGDDDDSDDDSDEDEDSDDQDDDDQDDSDGGDDADDDDDVVIDACTQGNLVANGSFEVLDAARIGTVHGISMTLLSSAAPGWDVYASLPSWLTSSGSGIELERSGVVTSSQEGGFHVELDSHGDGSNSTMTQGIAIPAGDYQLSFWYKPRTADAGDNTVVVAWNGSPVLTLDDVAEKSWQRYTVALNDQVAGTHTLSFRAAGTENSLGGLIDNISLSCASDDGEDDDHDDDDGSGDDDSEDDDDDVAGGSVTIAIVVVNDNGGTAVPSDFSAFINGNPVSTGAAVALLSGTHTVTETGPSGYTTTFSGACSAAGVVTVAASDELTCTITNDDNAPTNTITTGGNGGGGGGNGNGNGLSAGSVTIDLRIVGDNAEMYTPAMFDVFIGGNEVPAGVPQSILPGVYPVTVQYIGGAFTASLFRIAAGPSFSTTYGIDCGADGLISVTSSGTHTCQVTVSMAAASDAAPADVTPVPQVLGVVDVAEEAEEIVAAPVPRVLGAVDELPRTGGSSSPLVAGFMVMLVAGIALVRPYGAARAK